MKKPRKKREVKQKHKQLTFLRKMISQIKRPYFLIDKDPSRVPTEYVEKQHFVKIDEQQDFDEQDNQASVATPNQIKRDE